MSRIAMRCVTVMVTIFVAIGTVGFARTHTLPSLEGAAVDFSESMLSKLPSDVEFAVTHRSLRSLLLLKTAHSDDAGPVAAMAGLQASIPESADGTSPPEDETAMQPDVPAPTSDAPAPAEDSASAAASQTPAAEPLSAAIRSAERKVAFIYHSHNRESWLPELEGVTEPNEAFDSEINILLLGRRMQQKLEENGVGAIHSNKDYQTAVPSFNYNYSYAYSKTTVKEALAVHKDLTYLFDIHRDSQRKDDTTVTIDGTSYARLYFIIGKGNPHWEQNETFAKRIHEEMEKRLPGVSKGILGKGARSGHGEYNQSLSPASALIEIGGVDNTLEESYRTVDALASVIAELIYEAMAVDANHASAAETNLF